MKKAKVTLIALALLFSLLLSPASSKDEGIIAIKGKIVYTASGAPIKNGVILIKGGKIIKVGSRLKIPKGAAVYTAKVVMPGLVEAHSHFAVMSDANEATNPITPGMRVSDAINISDPYFYYPLSGGVTTIVTRPGSANVIGGLSAALKLKHNVPLDKMIIKDPCDFKMALEGNPIGVYGRRGRMPATMMGCYYLARKTFLRGQEYIKKWEKYEKEKKKNPNAIPPKRDLALEAVAMALKREIPVHIHTAKANEVDAGLRLFDEFHLDGSFAHAYWGYLIADELGKRKEVLVLGPEMFFHYFGEKGIMNSAAILAAKGAKIAVQTDANAYGVKYLRNTAALCVRYGLPEDVAIKAITINAADAVNLDDRVGSIEPGKDADIVLMDGDPFEVLTTVEKVFVDGKLEFENKKHYHTIADLKLAPPKISHKKIKIRRKSEKIIAITGGRIITVSNGVIDRGTILIENGKIKAVGRRIHIPKEATVIDASGKVIMPGIVAAASSLGLYSDWKRITHTDEAVNPVTPAMEVIHAIDPFFPTVRDVLVSGVTTANVNPGAANVLGGRGAVIKTVGRTVEEMLVKKHSMMMTSYCSRPKSVYGSKGRMPATRMAIAYLLRDNFLKAKEYKERLEKAKKEGREIHRDLNLEALIPVIEGKMPLMVEAERKSDILRAIEIADEFKIKLIILGGAEAHLVADQLAERNIPVVITHLREHRRTNETKRFRTDMAALLEKKGVKVGFMLDDARWPISTLGHQDGNLLMNAALCFKLGMSEEGAIKALTIYPAEFLNIADRVGSIEKGKDADIIILKGHPFLLKAVPELVMVNGKIAYKER